MAPLQGETVTMPLVAMPFVVTLLWTLLVPLTVKLVFARVRQEL